MARVTVEDCVDKVPNRFELVLLAAQRSRALSSGEVLTVDRDNDKNPVVALREIADETVVPEELREGVIAGMQNTLRLMNLKKTTWPRSWVKPVMTCQKKCQCQKLTFFKLCAQRAP